MTLVAPPSTSFRAAHYGPVVYGHSVSSWNGRLEYNHYRRLSGNVNIVGRGVRLDAARYKGVKALDQGCAITVEDLEGTARRQDQRAATLAR